MDELWEEIEQRLQDLGGDALIEDLLPPASQAELDDLARIVDSSLPDQLTAYLNIHNGSDGRYRIIASWELLPIQLITEKVNFFNGEFRDQLRQEGIDLDDEQESRGPVKPMIWNSGWIPFADDGLGNLLCVDTDPDEDGEVGQVILWSADPPYVEVITENLEDFFSIYLEDLRQDQYTFSDEDGFKKR